MHEITTQEIIYYGVVWGVAFLAAFARAIRDNESRNMWHGLSIGATAGFFSFGACGVLLDSLGRDVVGGWYCIFVSALIGLLAKEQDKIARIVLSKLLGAATDVIGSTEKKDKEN